MVDGALPPDVHEFLLEHADSIAQLEILLLLHDGAESKTPDAIARHLGVDAAWAARELADLAARGLLAVHANGGPPTYRFAPHSEEILATVDRVAQAMRERRVTVIETIARKPSRHLRVFADAFRLRKD